MQDLPTRARPKSAGTAEGGAINPLSIKARNYRSFGQLDLDLPQGAVAILGENGAGKSSVVNLIDLALFGPESRTLADALTDDTVEENLELELTFEHGDGVYRVRRTYSPRGRGQTKVDLEHLSDFDSLMDDGLQSGAQAWLPLTCETAAATQDALEELLGLSRETFRASAFLAQGDGAAFSEAAPRDRKRILCEVLGLDLWDRLLERARTCRRGAEDELVRVENTIAAGEIELAGRLVIEEERLAANTARGAAQLRIEQSERELATANEQLARARAMEAASVSAEQALEGARVAHGSALTRESQLRNELENLSQRLSGREALLTLSGQLPGLEETRGRLQQRTQDADEHVRLVDERNRHLAASEECAKHAAELRAHVSDIERSDDARCSTCGQSVEGEAKRTTISSMMVDVEREERDAREQDEYAQKLTAKIETLTSDRPTPDELAWVHDQIQRAQHAREQLAALDEAASRLTTLDAQLNECRDRLPVLEESVGKAQSNLRALLPLDGALSLPELDLQARDLAALIQGFRNTLTVAVETLARCDERLSRLAKIAADTDLAKVRRDALFAELDLLANLERAYGKDGIPALILETSAIPSLEVEAGRILSILGGAASNVELRTQRALKSGDGVKEALDIVLHTDTGERDYSTFSGGERTRIDLALRLALAKLLADRRGAQSRVLVIDEPDGLDQQGFTALVGILEGLQTTFDRIMVVSHQVDLQQAFDQTIEVVKENGRSRVVGAGDREAVPA